MHALLIALNSKAFHSKSPQIIEMNKELYRSRIYQQYVHARELPLAPTVLKDSSAQPYFAKVIKDHFPKEADTRILELGCGHGAFLYTMNQAGYKHAIGIDRSPQQIAEAHRLGITNVQREDIMEYLKMQLDASYDVVVTFDVIEHFTKAELIPLIDQINRVLGLGGRWIIHAPNAESPFGNRILFSDFTHEIAFTRTSISQLLLSSGFSKILCEECTPVVHGIKSLIRLILWKIIRSWWWVHTVVETGDYSKGCFTQNFLAIAFK